MVNRSLFTIVELLETIFPGNKKPLNCNFEVKFCIRLKTAFSKLSGNIITC